MRKDILPMKKKKTNTVPQLNKIMMRDDLSMWEIIEACAFIDICDCYEPVFNPPKEQDDEWRRMRGEYEPEPTLENTSFLYTWTSLDIDINTDIRLIIFSVAKDGEALYSQHKQDWELTMAQIMNSLLQNSDLN